MPCRSGWVWHYLAVFAHRYHNDIVYCRFILPPPCSGSMPVADTREAGMAERMLQFIHVPRTMPDKRGAKQRATDFAEIYDAFGADAAKAQASRCSQCGVPFCQQGCPAAQQYPDWLRLTAEGRLEEAYEVSPGHQHHAGDLRTHLPAGPAVRRHLRDRAVRPWHGDHRLGREIHHRHGVGRRLGEADQARAASASESAGSSAQGRRGWPRRTALRRKGVSGHRL
jgi:hypothetical protein